MLKLEYIIKTGIVLLSALFFFSSCDELEEDSLPDLDSEELIESQTNFRTAGESPLIINLFQTNAVNFTSEFTVAIDKTTESGTLEFVGDKLLKYTPAVTTGQDNFIFTATSLTTSETDTDTVVIDIGEDFPDDSVCHAQANYDAYAFVLGDQGPWQLNVADNDEFCNGQINEICVIYEDSTKGTAEIIETGGSFYLEYTPGPDFNLYDEFMYKVQVEFDEGNDSVAYALPGEPIDLYAAVYIYADSLPDGGSCFSVMDDFVALNGADTVLINVLENDSICLPDPRVLTITQNPTFGYAFIRNEADQNLIEYIAGAPEIPDSLDAFQYQVCAGGNCDTGWVYIDYGGSGDGDSTCTVQLADDWMGVSYCGLHTINVLGNDILCGNTVDTVAIIENPAHGQLDYTIYTNENAVVVEYTPDCGFWDPIPIDSTVQDQFVLQYLEQTTTVYLYKE